MVNGSKSASARQRVELAEGAAGCVASILDDLAAESVLLVADEQALRHSGAEAALASALAPRRVDRFTQFELNPKIADVERGVALFRRALADVVLAVGGGSAIDIAKVIGACGVHEGKPCDYVLGRRQLERAGPPLVAMPTTAGTGSEETHFAVVYVDRQKYSLAHEVLLPTHAIIDPLLTHSLPPRITAASGLDALCQAIESMWAVGATDESLDYATCALRLAIDHLEAAVRNPTPPARRAMAEAAHLAGKAINISKTTAPHAFSYALTTQCNVPHGMAVALTIGPLFVYNSRVEESDCLDPRGAAHVRARIAQAVELLGAASPVDAHHRLESLLRAVGCPTRLQAHGIAREDYGPLIEQVNVERLANNPRALDGAALAKLLLTIE